MIEAKPVPQKRGTRTGGVVKPNAPRWHQRVLAALIFLFEYLLALTLRVRWVDRAGVTTGQLVPPVIYCLWHNRLALSMVMWRYGRRHAPGQGLAALISASRDGAMLAATLEQFGVLPVRGSSSRRGGQALVELTSIVERGYNVAITPDGPRGPRYVVQPGAMTLAQLTGVPIVPLGFRASRKLKLKSWDQFQIPLPFARCEIIVDTPMLCPRDLSDQDRENLRQQLQDRLRLISED